MHIRLDPEVHRRARQRARELGISLAEYVRQLGQEDFERAVTLYFALQA